MDKKNSNYQAERLHHMIFMIIIHFRATAMLVLLYGCITMAGKIAWFTQHKNAAGCFE